MLGRLKPAPTDSGWTSPRVPDDPSRSKGTLVMKTSHLTVLSAAAFAFAASVFAQGPAAPPPVMMKQLKPDVWAGLGGSGGNSTIYIGKNSVIVVDAKQTEVGAKDLLAEIGKITPKPVTTVFLTHSDGDHVNGLVAYPTSVKVIAHE